MSFNAALVDRLNRNTAAHRELRETMAALLDTVRSEFHALVRFEARLLEYLRTITLYVDTKDRGRGGAEMEDRLARAEQRLLMLKREVDDRPLASSGRPPASGQVFSGRVDSTTYLGFEDRFRGASDEIRRRVEDYVPLLAGIHRRRRHRMRPRRTARPASRQGDSRRAAWTRITRWLKRASRAASTSSDRTR